MSFKKNRPVLLLTILAMGLGIGLNPPVASASVLCTDGMIVSTTDIETFPSDCNAQNMSVLLPDNLTIAIPQTGESASIFVTYASGNGDDATVTRNADGSLGVEFNEKEFGQVVESDGASSLSATIAPLAANSSTCTYGSYALTGGKWYSTHNWRYNPTNEANGASLTAIRTGLNTWRSGTNQCNSTAYSSSFPSGYLSTTSTLPSGTFTGCTSLDGQSVVGWRSLASGTLALTCTNGGSVTSEADVTFSTAVSWFSSTSTTGCVNQFDLISIATHEFGHVIGLNHVPQSSGQTMVPSFTTCQLAYRKLGLGDLNGLIALYP